MQTKKMKRAIEIEKYCDVEIRFIQQVPDNRQLSVWYSGELVRIKYGTYLLHIYADGPVSMKCFSKKYYGNGGDKLKAFFYKTAQETPEDAELLQKVHKGEIKITANKLVISAKNTSTNKTTVYPVPTKNIFKAVNEAYLLLERLTKF